MITLVVAGIAALLLGLCKTLFWSGPFPPDSGWSQRQRELINSFKSPWTWKAWITYWVERPREMKEAAEHRRKMNIENTNPLVESLLRQIKERP